MPLPEHVRALLDDGVDWRLPGDVEGECEGSRYHSPTPLLVMPVPLVPAEWSGKGSVASPKVVLCGTCRDNLTVLQRILHARDGDIPWQAKREFGNTIRAFGERGWRLYRETAEGA